MTSPEIFGMRLCPFGPYHEYFGIALFPSYLSFQHFRKAKTQDFLVIYTFRGADQVIIGKSGEWKFICEHSNLFVNKAGYM